MEKSTVAIRVAYDTILRNLTFCEDLINMMDHMTYGNIPIRPNIVEEFINLSQKNKDTPFLLYLTEDTSRNYLRIIPYQNYKSYIVTVYDGGIESIYNDICFEDIYHSLKLYLDMLDLDTNNKIFNLKDSYDAISILIADTGMKKTTLSFLYEIALKNEGTHTLYKYINEWNTLLFLLVFDTDYDSLSVYRFNKDTLSYERYFKKEISFHREFMLNYGKEE